MKRRGICEANLDYFLLFKINQIKWMVYYAGAVCKLTDRWFFTFLVFFSGINCQKSHVTYSDFALVCDLSFYIMPKVKATKTLMAAEFGMQ